MTISYWQSEIGLPGQDSPPDHRLEIETSLCIVGGGIIGAGTAYWAAQRGLTGVVLEAREAALGATGRNAGFILSGIADNYYRAVAKYGRAAARELWQLSIDNRNLMISLAERLQVPVQRCGSLLLAESEEEKEELARSAELLLEDNFPCEYVPYDPLDRGFYAGIRQPDDAVTQPAALNRALLDYTGFDLIAGSPVTSIEEQGDTVVVESDRAVVRARYVVLATNAFSVKLHPYFEDKILPMRGQIYMTEPAQMVFDTAGYSHFGYNYYRQVPEPDRPDYGRWLIGGCRNLHFDTENLTLDEEITTSLQADLEAWTATHFPEFKDLTITHRWAGIMGFTPDSLPLVGRLPDQERVAFSVGFNGHGMGLGILVARRAIERLLDESPPGMFDVNRLDRGRGLEGTPV